MSGGRRANQQLPKKSLLTFCILLQIVKDLGVSKGIWRWLTVFGVLTFCLLCPVFWGSLHNIYAIFLAHTSHRRWRAVYVLGLTISCLCVCILSIIWSMDFLLTAAIQRAIRISVLGLLFTGVSLC